MDKAFKVTKLVNDHYGSTTMVQNTQGEIYFRAYETAKLLGFSDEKACIRKYAENPVFIIINTEGGKQPVKCIPPADILKIAEKSRDSNAKIIGPRLVLQAQAQKIEDLELNNLFLSDDLDFAIASLKDLREQLDNILADLPE